MPTRQKKDNNPVVLKVGVALALSFAGFLCSRLRSKHIRLSLPTPLSPPSDVNDQVESRETSDDAHATPTTPSYPELPSDSKAHPMVSSNSSPSMRNSSSSDGFLLPEFYKLVQDIETPLSSMDGVNKTINDGTDEYEQEIKSLRSMVKDRREQERFLEIQLLEYYGLKEQEMMVMELQNRLKINKVEARALSLKIESLQEENRRLVVRVADYLRVVEELEAAKAKIKMLESKLQFDAWQNKEQISRLKQRVLMMDLQETRGLENLETELEELRMSQYELQRENSELGSRLDSTQILANSMMEDDEVGELRNEDSRLREENKNLVTDVERLQSDRCSDAVELVYLRWVNACLRYELRNYNPPHGRTISSRDLSKSMSPKSEAKAKQLILEYANNEEKDLEYGQWSLADAPVHRSKKLKIFDTLRRLITGKENNDHNNMHNKTPALVRSRSVEDLGKAYSFVQRRNSISMSSQSLTSTRSSWSSSYSYKSFVLGKEKFGTILPFESRFAKGSEELCLGKSDSVRCEETLKDSSLDRRRHKKSASYGAL